MDDQALLFRDPNTDDEAILRAVAQLSAAETPASLWSGVANNQSFRPFHRAVAVRELFRQHVRRSMTLGRVAALLAGGCWLTDAWIERIELVGGEALIPLPVAGAAFVIRLARMPSAREWKLGLYLAVDELIDAETLRDALMSKAANRAVAQIRVLDLAVFPESSQAGRCRALIGLR